MNDAAVIPRHGHNYTGKGESKMILAPASAFWKLPQHAIDKRRGPSCWPEEVFTDAIPYDKTIAMRSSVRGVRVWCSEHINFTTYGCFASRTLREKLSVHQKSTWYLHGKKVVAAAVSGSTLQYCIRRNILP